MLIARITDVLLQLRKKEVTNPVDPALWRLRQHYLSPGISVQPKQHSNTHLKKKEEEEIELDKWSRRSFQIPRQDAIVYFTFCLYSVDHFLL